MRKIFLLLLLSLSLSGRLTAQDMNIDTLHKKNSDCQVCHLCTNPTVENPCLRPCPRFSSLRLSHSPEDGPDTLILDKISVLYVPVVFAHQLHAEMSGMAGGCQVCHHHNPADEILLCEECHPVSATASDLRKPSLKGAYHRQCLACHREWSHSTNCAVCHALKSTPQQVVAETDSTDMMGADHPLIPEPEKIVYETDSEEGKIVTFYHGEHVNLFEFKCVDCHQTENCSKCHDMSEAHFSVFTKSQAKVNSEVEEKEPHQRCFSCHENSKCKLCHAKTEKGIFNHQVRSGWVLNRYHSKISCRSCHKQKTNFIKLDSRCITCHQDWNPENFKHAVTGLDLDENHLEQECEECHTEKRYDAKPVCNNCHDEDIAFPKNLPGTRIKQNGI
jgi:hypothetical protein